MTTPEDSKSVSIPKDKSVGLMPPISSTTLSEKHGLRPKAESIPIVDTEVVNASPTTQVENKAAYTLNAMVQSMGEQVTAADVYKYLLDIAKRFNGYKFISVSPMKGLPHKPYSNAPGDSNKDELIGKLESGSMEEAPIGVVTAHTHMPAIQSDGIYRSPKDKLVSVILLKDIDNFKGLIMDRSGNLFLGDAFCPHLNEPNAISALDILANIRKQQEEMNKAAEKPNTETSNTTDESEKKELS